MEIKISDKDSFLSKQEIPILTNSIRVTSRWYGFGSLFEYNKKRFDFIVHCKDYGLSLKEIGEMMRMSKQGVYRIYRYGLDSFSQEIKGRVRKRDDFRCRICRKKLNSITAHTHHIDSSRDHSTGNLVTLCGSCHKKIEFIKKNDGVEQSIRALKVIPLSVDKSK